MEPADRGRFPIGAVMVTRASHTLAASLKELAADKLEAAVADLEIADGMIRIAGTDRAISYAEIAALPAATPDKLKAIESFKPPNATYPNGTHACEVEIDPETGVTQIVRYSIVDDFGFTLNPLLLAGQVHGGVAQGVGQALMERAVFDPSGQLLTASFMDYAMPRADNLSGVRFRNPQCSVHHQSARLERRGRGGFDRIDAGRDERGGRRLVALTQGRTYRYARDAVRGLRSDPARGRAGVSLEDFGAAIGRSTLKENAQ